MTTIADRLRVVEQRIAAAARAAGRDPAAVSLLAVSKTWGPDAVREAVAAGQRAFGENYVQEGADKVEALRAMRLAELGADEREPAAPGLEWHFIGPLQSNKTRRVANTFDWVHSIDRLKIAERLADQRAAHLAPLKLCIQVNVSAEDSKSGVAPEQLGALAHAVAALPRLQLRGLMCIPEPSADAAVLRARFAVLRARFAVLRELQAGLVADGLVLDTLSMGMSQDIELAVAEGATIVRVGSAIFGDRNRQAATEK